MKISLILGFVAILLSSNLLASSSCGLLWSEVGQKKLEGSDFKTLEPKDPNDSDGFIVSAKEVPLVQKNILKAYANGAFPWNPDSSGNIAWYTPKEHGVIWTSRIVDRNGHEKRDLRKTWNKAISNGWTITFNRAFDEVVKNCAEHKRKNYSHVWLVDEVQKAFSELHKNGYAHSVEVWNREGELIAGVYGLYQNGVFSGESMFHKESNASRVAVIALSEVLYKTGHRFQDTQTVNNNSRTHYFAEGLSRSDYLKLIAEEAERTKHLDPKDIFPTKVMYPETDF